MSFLFHYYCNETFFRKLSTNLLQFLTNQRSLLPQIPSGKVIVSYKSPPLNFRWIKGQLISKAIYGQLTSPKKQMDEFVLFAFLLFTVNKSNSSVCFLGESTACQSAFRFYLTFSRSKYLRFFCCNCTHGLTYDEKRNLMLIARSVKSFPESFFLRKVNIL